MSPSRAWSKEGCVESFKKWEIFEVDSEKGRSPPGLRCAGKLGIQATGLGMEDSDLVFTNYEGEVEGPKLPHVGPLG